MTNDVLAELTSPADDRAWKLAAGHVLGEIHQQVVTTNGRVTRLERAVLLIAGAAGAGLAPVVAKILEAGVY